MKPPAQSGKGDFEVRKSIVMLLFLALSPFGHAETVDMATIERIMMDRNYGEILYIELDRRQSTPIACHANSVFEFTLDVSDALGQKIYAALLTLYASARPARFVGTDTCSLYPSIETLRRIELK